jgi:aryl-alcohol dehydrogenase-like predicted oxidoreductase
MSSPNQSDINRREFVQQSGLFAGGVLMGAAGVRGAVAAESPSTAAEAAPGVLPRRKLGRTGVSVTTMTLGTAPCGLSPDIPPPEIAKIVNCALDQGIDSIDTAPAYKQSEEGIGLALGGRRKQVFLATKVLADTLDEARESLDNSFRLLKTDWIDLVYYHSVGAHDVRQAMEPDGVFSWLVKQKQAGRFRFLGISGHHKPGLFVPLLETGEVDVLLAVVNFVDRYTYGFEHKVLPVARQHGVGIVAMKVFGGARKSTGSYENPKSPPELDLEHLQSAVRYSLGTPGVSTVNLGVHNCEQLRQNVKMVRNFKPLLPEEQTQLANLGKDLANQWGEHFGPVA